MDPTATRRSYDAVAERYAARISDELRGKPLDRALLDAVVELSGHGTVADIGCGPGHVGAYLAARGATVIGADLSTGMAGLAARHGPAVAADMTALPIATATLSGLVCLYAVIHLTDDQRATAYCEFARVLKPRGYALVAFHTSSPDAAAGDVLRMREWWGHEVDLTFRYLDPDAEAARMADAGFDVQARMDRAPHPDVEHPSRRSYLLGRVR